MAARNALGLISGAVSAVLALELVFIASTLRLVPFAPFALALAVVDLTPGPVGSALIDALQFWAKGLVEGLAVALTLGAGALSGVLSAAGASRTRVLAVASTPWALAVLAALAFAGRQFDPVGTAVAGVIGVAGYAYALRSMERALRRTTSGSGRRRVLVGMGALGLLLGASGMFLASLTRQSIAVARALVLPRPPAVTLAPFAPEDAAFETTPGLAPQLTANRDFYVIDTALFKPSIDVAEWKLTVDGMVERPFQLSYEELLALDAVEQVQTLECISNPVGGELISTAKWTGVRVADLLARAGVKADAFDLLMTSWDGYTDSIRLPKALEPTTLLAYGMNDDVLPVEHGYPARMLIPDIYGMKNVKWVSRLTLASFDVRGYWQERGWSDLAIVLTRSRIDVPTRVVRWSGGPVRIAGVAFAGARGIRTVEVSADQGRTWGEARLGREVNAFTWRRWYYDWTPAAAGEAKLMVRAVDGKGVPQVSLKRDPFPNGATGYHLVTVRVERTS